ncbi:MAG: peptide ABC transporter substrate-binding protein [Puniceicoccaceae bacterium]|nr:peptide ABC transporter substrate-binding protein [Puniceicoccaceae bacterium]
MKSSFVLSSALLALLVFHLACAPAKTNVERGISEQTLYIGIGSEPEGLDPHLVSGVTEHYVLLALFEGLTTVDPKTLEIRPGVAESWSVSADAKTYTFFLDGKAAWSNGDPVTADDFVFSYQRILSPQLGAPYAYMLYSIEGAEAFNKGTSRDFSSVGVRAINARTLEIKLHSPTPYFLSLPTHFTWWPVHPPTILKHGAMTDRISKWTQAKHFVGNGPFALKSWRLNNVIRVRQNSFYRQADSVELKGIHFLPINLETEERAFRAGQIHITSGVPTARIDWYRKNRPQQIRFDPYLGVYYYLINTERAPLNDPRVRRALAYTIDRETLTEFTLKGGQKPAYHFTPPNTGGYHAKEYFTYDPETARALLTEAGFPNGEGFPEIELLYNTSESHKTVAEAIQQMWKKELGIDIRLHNQEWKVYLNSRQEGDFAIARAAWIGDYLDPYTFLSLGISDSGNNHSGWKDAEFDSLMERATRSQDTVERLEIFQSAEQRLIEAMPFIPIYFYVRSLLIDESVQGWHSNILDYHPYQFIRLEKPE